MDRTVIFGAFNFLGFHFCCSLLDEGFEVTGIRSDNDEKNPYVNEKRMAIGRNANFYEESFSNWLSKGEVLDQTLFVIDYYDLLAAKQMEDVQLVEDFIKKNKMTIAETDSRIVSLYPFQSFLQTNEMSRRIPHDMDNIRIFLPTIYGPWQPSSFLFQQYLLKTIEPNRQISQHEYEWIHDTLYIDDIIDPIFKLAEGKPDGTYVLKSDIKNHWQKCADYLAIPSEIIDSNNSKETLDNGEFNIKIVKSNTHFSEGLENQKRHLKLLHEGGI